MKICQAVFKLWLVGWLFWVNGPLRQYFSLYRAASYGVDTKIVNTQRAITQKVGKAELQFMCSALCLMVLNICVKFHENMSSGFKVMERTRKLLTHKGQ